MPLYLEYPKEYFDLYLYGPIFAILIAPFSVLPDGLSVILWNGMNSVVLFVTLWHLPIVALDQPLNFMALDRIGSGDNLEEVVVDFWINAAADQTSPSSPC